MSKGVKFSTREWWLLIFILILIQFVVQWFSYQYSGSSNALGYISFAGTLVSIILGLVAIIYSFVQSISHTSTVAEIKDQVERLILAGVDITKSKDDLHASAFELSKIADDLASKVTENTSATKEIVGSVSKLSDAFVSGLSSSTTQEKVDNLKDDGEPIGTIIESNRVLVVFMVVAIYEGCKRGFSISDITNKVLKPLSEKNIEHFKHLEGALSGVAFSLEAEGFLELSQGDALETKVEMKRDFQERVKELLPGTMDGEEKIFTSLWVVINNLE